MNDLAQIYPTDHLAPTEPLALPEPLVPESFTKDPLINEPKATTLATRMGRLLLQSGKINNNQLSAIINLQSRDGMRFGDAAIKLGYVKPDDIKTVLGEQFAYPNIRVQDTKLSPCLTAAFQPDSAQAEALRSLRSELSLRYFNTANHLGLALIGAEDAEGIALTCANLAISFSRQGIRTLLVDANLRDPQLHNWFGLDPRQAGLSDWLAGRTRPLPQAIPELRSLWVLPAGTRAPNPQELLASRQYNERMNALAESYEVILINTSPLDKTRDAQLVAAQAGAALLVTREHQTRMKDLVTLCNGLKGLGIRLLGAALRQ
jgi:protein-tyrosine kinase